MGQRTSASILVAIRITVWIQGLFSGFVIIGRYGDWLTDIHSVRQGGYVIVVICLFVCFSVSNFVQKLLNGFACEIFSEGWQWANKQMTKFW